MHSKTTPTYLLTLALAALLLSGCAGNKPTIHRPSNQAAGPPLPITAVELDTNGDGAIDIELGGTGGTTAAAARTALGLGSVANTADLAKPISTATQDALDLKASISAVLTKTNTTTYAPTADYNPATKKYVDDAAMLSGTYTDEQAQDAVGAMLTGNTETGITVTYDDASNKINFVVTAAGVSLSTANTWTATQTFGDMVFSTISTSAVDGSRRSILPSNTTIAPTGGGVVEIYNEAGAIKAVENNTEYDVLLSRDIGAAVQAYDADLAKLAAPTAWRVFYSNGSSVITEVALGADGTYLRSNGATSAPSFTTPAGGGMATTDIDTSAELRAILTDEVGTGAAYFVGGALGTPASATLTNATGLPVAGITASTATAIGVGTVELGHASDTTIARSAAGVVTIEGITIAKAVASGTSALGTAAIASGACATAVTTTATGTATTDVIDWGFNGDPTGVVGYQASANGMLTVVSYPSTNNVSFKVCNNTAASITPGAVTLNWRVIR